MFDPGKLYFATDPALRTIAPASTMRTGAVKGAARPTSRLA